MKGKVQRGATEGQEVKLEATAHKGGRGGGWRWETQTSYKVAVG